VLLILDALQRELYGLGCLAWLNSAAYGPDNHGNVSTHHHAIQQSFYERWVVYIEYRLNVTFYLPLELFV